MDITKLREELNRNNMTIYKSISYTSQRVFTKRTCCLATTKDKFEV